MKRRGPPPQPTHLKLIKGTLRKSRVNPAEPKLKLSQVPPIPPDFLSIEAQQEWNRVCSALFWCGVVTEVDRASLAAYCQAYGRWEVAERLLAEMSRKDETSKGFMVRTVNGNAIQNPVLGSANKAMSDMMRYAVELGLTPSARSRIHAQPPENADPSSKYLA